MTSRRITVVASGGTNAVRDEAEARALGVPYGTGTTG